MHYLFLEDPIYETPKNHLALVGNDSIVEHDRCEDSAKDETILIDLAAKIWFNVAKRVIFLISKTKFIQR